MPRRPRIDLPHITQHVVQRGNDRQPCFFTSSDYERYRSDLREITLHEGCEIHAYVLMTNHVHLLMTPNGVGQVARIMQSLGRRYVRYVNDRHHRTGTLWEGRYKSCLVGTARYLLRCYRYSTPCGRRWSNSLATTAGQATAATHPAFSIRWSVPILPTLRSEQTRNKDARLTASS